MHEKGGQSFDVLTSIIVQTERAEGSNTGLHGGHETIEAQHGYILALWPLVWIVRRWRRNSGSDAAGPAPSSDFVELPSPINAALVGWLRIESLAMRLLRWRNGVSLVVRARRR